MTSQFEEFALNAGDVVIGMDRTFTQKGVKVSVLTAQDLPCLLVQRVGRFLPRGIPADFMRVVVQSFDYQQSIMRQQKGMDIPHLSKSEILAPFVAVPSAESEMIAIAKCVNVMSSLEHSDLAYLQKLRAIKVGITSDLLTGKVRAVGIRNNKTVK
jgi:type I restriction enzyme S subunit